MRVLATVSLIVGLATSVPPLTARQDAVRAAQAQAAERPVRVPAEPSPAKCAWWRWFRTA